MEINNSLLYDTNYLKIINHIIKKTKKDYALRVYNIENLENIPNEEIQLTVYDQPFLESMLLEIRGKTVSYANNKKKKTMKEKA